MVQVYGTGRCGDGNAERRRVLSTEWRLSVEVDIVDSSEKHCVVIASKADGEWSTCWRAMRLK